MNFHLKLSSTGRDAGQIMTGEKLVNVLEDGVRRHGMAKGKIVENSFRPEFSGYLVVLQNGLDLGSEDDFGSIGIIIKRLDA